MCAFFVALFILIAIWLYLDFERLFLRKYRTRVLNEIRVSFVWDINITKAEVPDDMKVVPVNLKLHRLKSNFSFKIFDKFGDVIENEHEFDSLVENGDELTRFVAEASGKLIRLDCPGMDVFRKSNYE